MTEDKWLIYERKLMGWPDDSPPVNPYWLKNERFRLR